MADSTQRDKVKNHLEAAREWLGSASGALEKREDIKSELDIMLAEAELTRAREMKNAPDGEKGLRRRANLLRQVMRLAPLAAALAIAAMWLRFSAVTLPVKPTPPTPPVVARPQVPQGRNRRRLSRKPRRRKTRDILPGPQWAEKRGQRDSRPPPLRKKPPKENSLRTAGKMRKARRITGPASRRGGPGMIPDSSTQQMMLDAAKILRQAK